MKLSGAQQEVISLMRDGWELGTVDVTDRRRCWLQKNGIGKGGETKEVRFTTANALLKARLIESFSSSYRLNRFRLTQAIKLEN